MNAAAGEVAVDLGAGVGAAGLALARRVAGVTVHLVEIDPELAALARENAERNGLAGRVAAHALDVAAPPEMFAAAGLAAGSTDRVLMNPPFHAAGRAQASPDARRRIAHLAPAGTLTVIFRADGLGELLAALAPAFGAVAIQPVHPKPGAAAIRVLVCATKGSAAPSRLLPALVLNGEDGRPSAAAEAVLREGTALPLGYA